MTSNCSDYARHYQNTFFGLIKSNTVNQLHKLGEFWIINLVIKELIDEILKDITILKPIRSEAKSLTGFNAKILTFANNMEENGGLITQSAEAPFIMSELLSKLLGADNIEFGREMVRAHEVENITNLIT